MKYVRFGKLDDHGKFRETLGTDSFFQIDGRLTAVNAHERAIEECRRRGYDGFTYYRGHNILDARAYGHPAIISHRK